MVKTFETRDDVELAAGGLAPAVGIEEFRNDVTNVFLHYVRNIGWMVDSATAWAITKAPTLDNDWELFNPDLDAADLGLRYEHIQESEFARAMQRMYDYAYLGQLELGQEALEYESIHTWITALVVDVATSAVGYEWESFGLDILSCASRCTQVAETANARLILEGGEPFFSSFRGNAKDDTTEEGVLTVRQVSLLSGMEEMSIRAAANPNRVNQLKPTKTDSGTRFEIQVVKDWLISKRRYIPITKRWSAGEFDLRKKRFGSLVEVDLGLSSRYRMICCNEGSQTIDPQLEALSIIPRNAPAGPYLSFEESDFKDEAKIRALARALALPEELLVLRIQQVLASEQLRAIEDAIKAMEDQ